MGKKTLSLLALIGLFTSCSNSNIVDGVNKNANINNNIVEANADANISLADTTSSVTSLELNTGNSLSLIDGQTFQIRILNTTDEVEYTFEDTVTRTYYTDDTYDTVSPTETAYYKDKPTSYFMVSDSGLITVDFKNKQANTVLTKSITIQLKSDYKVSTTIRLTMYSSSKINDLFAWKESENEITVIGFKDQNLGLFTFPETISKTVEGKDVQLPIVHIAKNAFAGCKNLVSLGTLPSTIETIGANAFYGCEKLQGTITIPSSVTRIEDKTFYNCKNLSSIVYETSGIEYIGKYAFFGCENLDSCNLNYSSSVTVLEDYTFARCSSLTSLNLRSTNIREIRFGAFKDCTGLSSLTLPANVTKIAAYAFSNTSITSLTLPGSLSTFSADAIINCNITSLSVDASNTNFKMLTNGSGETYALASYDGTIIYYALSNVADNFSSVASSIKEIKPFAFYNYVASGTSLNLSNFTALETIGEYAFANSELVSLTDVDSLTYIGRGAFANSSLTSFTLPSTITEIADDTFINCISLTGTIDLSYITKIGNSAFKNCDELTGVSNTNNIVSIGECAFYGCSKINAFTVSSATTYIGNMAFKGCADDLTITINQSSIPSTFAKLWNIDEAEVVLQ